MQVAEGEKVVVLYYPRSVRDDNEDRRLVTLLRQKGLVPVQLPDEKGPREDQPRLLVRHGRVLLAPAKAATSQKDLGSDRRSRSPVRRRGSPVKQPAPHEEPVGLVVLLSEPTDVQPGHPSTKLRSAIDEARSRISAYEEMEKKEVMKASRNEKSLVSMKAKVEFLDTDGNKSSLQMKGGKLIWTWTDKNTNQSERIDGPIRYNAGSGRLTFGESYHYKPDAEGTTAPSSPAVLKTCRMSHLEKTHASLCFRLEKAGTGLADERPPDRGLDLGGFCGRGCSDSPVSKQPTTHCVPVGGLQGRPSDFLFFDGVHIRAHLSFPADSPR